MSGCCMQALYRISIALHLQGYGVSDTASERFGVREVHSAIDPALKGHVFSVNGVRVSLPFS
jgi:hypothetical protein